MTTIANQPEPTNPFEGNAKQYTTLVRLSEEDSAFFRPGMTAEVEILVAHLDNALSLPIAAVVAQNDKYYAWTHSDGAPERRELSIGFSNDEMVEVKDGVLEGDRVVLNPRSMLKEARHATKNKTLDAAEFGT